jgi:hypothetical protein
VKAWAFYAGAAAVLLCLLVLVLSAVLPGTGSALWFAAGVALGIQLVAFGALVLARRWPGRFLWGWVGGAVVRFVAVAGVAVWATRRAPFPAEPALFGLVGFVFVLMLMEAWFVRMAH